VTMGFDRTTREGTHVALGVSRDGAKTWTWQQLASNPRVDRPWVTVASDGSVHVIWNDGAGVHHTSSNDSGTRFGEIVRVADRGGSSHFAAGPNGRLAIRVTPISASGNQLDEDYDFLLVSKDAGRSWQRHEVPGERLWAQQLPRWVEPIAWTGDGSLFYLWSEGAQLYLARSTNDGASWTTQAFAEDEAMCFFPWLGTDGQGGLVASWFAFSDGMSVHAAQVRLQDDGLVIMRSPPLPFESWTESEDGWTRDTAGEYVPVARLSDGDLAVVTPLQDPRDDRMGFSFWRLAPSND
ncbi:MAG: sialidase family protein, partial [Pseudomonadota bacterium]